MRSLQNSINHVSEKAQHQMNLMGDAFCSETANRICDTICEDDNEDILRIKSEVESLQAKTTLRARVRHATINNINGVTFCPDNVGFVSIQVRQSDSQTVRQSDR